MKSLAYETITGRKLDLNKLTPDERKFLVAVEAKYQSKPEWTEFASWWLATFTKSSLSSDSVAYRLCQDLEARLGIEQGKVAAPDYRDYLVDLIEDKYGSRYRFCKETGVDPGHLSRVLAGRAELSLQLLEKVVTALGAALIVEPEKSLRARARPDEAGRALAAATR